MIKGMCSFIVVVALEIVLVGELWVLRVALDWFLGDYVERIRKWAKK